MHCSKAASGSFQVLKAVQADEDALRDLQSTNEGLTSRLQQLGRAMPVVCAGNLVAPGTAMHLLTCVVRIFGTFKAVSGLFSAEVQHDACTAL